MSHKNFQDTILKQTPLPQWEVAGATVTTEPHHMDAINSKTNIGGSVEKLYLSRYNKLSCLKQNVLTHLQNRRVALTYAQLFSTVSTEQLLSLLLLQQGVSGSDARLKTPCNPSPISCCIISVIKK